ncbi:MAG: hypothetical protein ACR2LF_13310 [Jatrophihabitantaceae bacterium]
MSTSRKRLPIVAAVLVAVLVGGFFGIRALWRVAAASFASDQCTVGSFDLDPAQAAVASTMVGAVSKFPTALPERAAVLVLAAGLQESKLRNLPPGAGDRDSVGVLQQRPSQGWGDFKAAPLNDVFEATTEFLQHLVKIPNWQTMSVAAAVQEVQVSADGSAYAQHEEEAQALADALQGHKPAAISCSFAKPTKVALGATVATQVRKDLPVNPPVVSGPSVRVPGASWQTAAWFVANADRLGIERVAYSGKQWSRAGGWASSSAGTTAVVATLYQA